MAFHRHSRIFKTRCLPLFLFLILSSWSQPALAEDFEKWREGYPEYKKGLLEKYDPLKDQFTEDEKEYRDIRSQGATPDGKVLWEAVLKPRYRADTSTEFDVAQLDVLDECKRIVSGKRVAVRVTSYVEPRGKTSSHQTSEYEVSSARARFLADYLKDLLGVDSSFISHSGLVGPPPDQKDGKKTKGRQDCLIVQVFPLSGEADLMPSDFSPWWTNHIADKLTPARLSINESIDSLFVRALKNSSQIKVFADLPLIRETAIQEAKGQFDPKVFLESKYSDVNEPVGDILRTGGPDRYKATGVISKGGISQPLILGSEITLEQEVRSLDTNSIFFRPKEQAITTLKLSFVQPLLKKAGIEYNRSTITLAKIDESISMDEFRRQVESHLLEIVRSYWELYLNRAALIQKRKLVRETEGIVTTMKQRVGVDAMPSQVARAQSLLLARQTDVVRTEFALKNNESRLVALINDPEFMRRETFEIVPKEMPQMNLGPMHLKDAFTRALQSRPEIDQVIKQIKAASIRANMAKNELLPSLNFVLETYLMGLEGDYQYGKSFDSQFNPARPSLAVGLRLEYPLGNNAAEARDRRRRLEVRQLSNQLRTTVESVLLEVQVSFTELVKTHREMVMKYQILKALLEEEESLKSRENLLLADKQLYAIYLDNLLDLAERRLTVEHEFTKSLVTYNLALQSLNKATGLLVDFNDIKVRKDREGDLPVLIMEKNG